MSDLLGMSDEDFLKLNEPGPAPASASASASVEDGNETQTNDKPPVVDPAVNDEADQTKKATQDANGAAGSDDDAGGQAGDKDGPDGKDDASEGSAASSGSKAGSDDGDSSDKAGASTKVTDEAAAQVSKEGTKDGAEPGVKTEPKSDEPPNYEAFFKEVMKPFKANGKVVEPRTPEEVIRLMQMGAGFGRKLQDMQPHLKTIRMLEKENLLDPIELSFLIDLRNKNPDAIKKLIKDSNIDPLDLNMQDNVEYNPVNRSVSDAEVVFEDALANLKDRPTGAETIQIISQTWDQDSMALLWDQPKLLEVFQTQRENGIYDQVVAEIEHQKTFGNIPPKMPFIQAYTIAGDALVKSNRMVGATADKLAPVTETPKPASQPQVIATRTQTPKPDVVNSDKAKAAASSPSSTKKASAVINPLNMPDEDFMKAFEGRL